MKRILIAGGTGLIGQELENKLTTSGYEVLILSRNPKGKNQVFWSPKEQKIDLAAIGSIDVIINLCGAGIADKPWSKARKKELLESRIGPANFLFSIKDKFPKLTQYITASGVNCYGYDQRAGAYVEGDDFGTDYLSTLVREWETSADQFSPEVNVAKLRISMVLSENGGALEKLSKAVKWNLGSPIASGKQWMTWVHMDDLVASIQHAMEQELSGAFNILGNYTTNEVFMKALAARLNKRMWMPNVPGFLMKLILGEMAEMLINGVKVSNDKMTKTGFEFTYTDINKAFSSLRL